MILDGIRRFDPVTGEIEFVLLKADFHRTWTVIHTLDRLTEDEGADRFDWIEVDEDLELAGGDAARFAGMPILDGDHSAMEVAGVVTGMRLEDDAIVCTGRISSKSMAADIEAGRLPAVSFGYVRRVEEIEWRQDEVPILHVRRWEPVEVNLMPQAKAA